ncbi:PAS domain S-box protein [Chitinophaga rhizophila]|uniref:histidine kinase n=1 Tax=Chitinophaga rhizophila TaxID=2866212 RepID=A0ABS7G629_9BACT|nr:PAS domain S-box protein [Chitinophaga rhizophila]MBW8683092.1 PAS domain S-box protein [Chitinophaga rhizophila]
MNNFLVAGIGAAEGGIEALEAFFQVTPVNAGIAYIVLLHSSPGHNSPLAAVLQRLTAMPVMQVTHRTAIRPDVVYVIPSDKNVEITDGYLTVTDNADIATQRAPVDVFLRSLANAYDGRSVCILLSGLGANGSMGLKRVKERGGAVFVQHPGEANFNEMPRHAIATGMVDEILYAREIPAKIINYRKASSILHIDDNADEQVHLDEQVLRSILTELRLHTGYDFTEYKEQTLLRRIGRRLPLHGLPDLPAYATFLRQHPDESNALLKDLLISVTNFFRDKRIFEELKTIILPKILDGKAHGDGIRIWIAGCATGEEAYSIAMLCADLTADIPNPPKIQLFATDIDERAILAAREGFYTINDAADIPPDLLGRHFISEKDGYRVRSELREMILFASHNFLKDPPFSHIDLISCRNVLIYLNRSTQERVVQSFHFALNPGGFLLLGTAESVDGASELYDNYSRELHIWQTRRSLPKKVVISQRPVIKELPTPQQKTRLRARPEQPSFGPLHLRLLELYAPPSLIVNDAYDIVHSSEHAGKYLRVAGGEPTRKLLKLVPEELRADLRTALYTASRHKVAATASGLKMYVADQAETLNIHVRPAPELYDPAAGDFLLVIFEAVTDQKYEVTHVVASDEPARRLDEEIVVLKAQLRAVNEKHELAIEELKSGNEELQAMYEELRAASDEMESGKEELQSINEELRAVNHELKIKVEESSMTSNNLRNIINSTDIGTIILDRNFQLVLFTPAAGNIFNLIPADLTRPLSDITSRLIKDNLVAIAEKVLLTLHSVEQEMETSDGGTFLTRITPYRTDQDRILGVVISFVDITASKKVERALRNAEEWRKLIIESAADYAILTLDPDRKVNSWNSGAQNVFGYADEEMIGRSGDELFVPEDRLKGDPEKEAALALTVGRAENERWHLRRDKSRFWGSGITHPLRDDNGNPVGFVKIMQDLTGRKHAEQALMQAHTHLSEILESIGDFFYALDKDYCFTYVNNKAEEAWGVQRSAILGKPFLAAFPQAANSESWRMQLQVMETRESVHYEVVSPFLHRWISVGIFPSSSGGISVFFHDIEDRKRTEHALRASEARTRTLADTIPHILWANDVAGQAIYFNKRWFDYSGLSEEDAIGPGWQAIVHPDDATQAIERWNMSFAAGEIFDTEFRLRRHDGVYRWFIVRNVPLKNHAGEMLHWFGSATDIEELKNLQDHLTRSEERLRVTTESAVDYAIISMDLNRIVQSWSSGAERIFEYTEQEMQGRSADIIFTPEDRAAGAPEQEMVMARDEGRAPDERWHMRKDGRRFYMSGVMRPIYHQGTIAGYVKVARDMTRQKEGDEMLRLSEERYRIALASAEMAAWDWNTETDSVVWNEQHFHILGLMPDGKEKSLDFFTRFIHTEDVDKVSEALQNVVNGESQFNMEFRIRRADNDHIRWMSGFGRAVTRDEHGHAARMVGVMYDITPRKRIQEQKDEFISIASHELRTPVTSMKAYTQLLQEILEERGDTQNVSLMKKLDRQVDRLISLIFTLLDATQITEGKLKLHKTDFPIDELIMEVVDIQQGIAGSQQIVPMLKANTIIHADQERIRQVVINLIANAIKYAPGTEQIIVTSGLTDGSVTICVQDFGVGLDEREQQKIFERFFRDEDVGSISGLGLSLYISAMILRRHGGGITVASQKGAGALFCITLPIRGDE